MQDPKTIAIIMDGNRRWARKSNLPVIHGHRKGIETLIKIVKASKRKGIKKLVVFAFSTENWSRQLLEVNGLMNLISFGTDTNLEELIENEVKLTFIGNIDSLPSNQKKDIAKCVEYTKKFTSFNLIIGLNYGGHWDIVNSVKKIQYSKKNISEKNFPRHTASIPAPKNGDLGPWSLLLGFVPGKPPIVPLAPLARWPGALVLGAALPI